ncbi:X8 domain protein [Raphanus sativus]|nr:X8 domain protein [Raphanus sativus]
MIKTFSLFIVFFISHHASSRSSPPQPQHWCVGKPGTAPAQLQENLDFSCVSVPCDEESCLHVSSTTLYQRSSFAMNLYYKQFGETEASCFFKQSGILVDQNPSSLVCSYEERGRATEGGASGRTILVILVITLVFVILFLLGGYVCITKKLPLLNVFDCWGSFLLSLF